jgi:hypothetical protein
VLLPGLRAPALPGFPAEYVPWPGRQLGNTVKPPATEEVVPAVTREVPESPLVWVAAPRGAPAVVIRRMFR